MRIMTLPNGKILKTTCNSRADTYIPYWVIVQEIEPQTISAIKYQQQFGGAVSILN